MCIFSIPIFQLLSNLLCYNWQMQNYCSLGRFTAQKFGANINIYEWEMIQPFNYIQSTKQSCSHSINDTDVYYWSGKGHQKLFNERQFVEECVQYGPHFQKMCTTWPHFHKIACVCVCVCASIHLTKAHNSLNKEKPWGIELEEKRALNLYIRYLDVLSIFEK